MSGSISSYISQSPFANIIAKAEQGYGLPSGLLGAQLYQESTLGAYAGNGGGIGQFIPSTGQQYGVDPNNPESGINGAAHYMADLYNQSGSWVSALQSYGTLPSDLSNLGPGQQNVYNIAAAADGNGGSASQASGKSSGGWFSSLNPANWLKDAEQWLGLKLFNTAIYVVAILFLLFGVADLVFGAKPAQIIEKAKGAVGT